MPSTLLKSSFIFLPYSHILMKLAIDSVTVSTTQVLYGLQKSCQFYMVITQMLSRLGR